MVRLWRSSRPLLALARDFSSTPAAVTETAPLVKKQQSTYYERIKRKFPKLPNGSISQEKLNRMTYFLVQRGIPQTQALRVISCHVLIVQYSTDLIESKIDWLSNLGLSQGKINDIIVRHPNILGIRIDKYEAVADWYISHGVPRNKIPFLFNVFPQAVSSSIKRNLDPKVEFLREVGLDVTLVTRVLSNAPQIFSLSIERMHMNVNYLVELGVLREKVASIISRAPRCLTLAPGRIKETVDLLDEMFGEVAGVQALTFNVPIVMSSLSGLRDSFNYLISVGYSRERLEKNTRFLTRNVGRFLRPRVEFLKAKNNDVVDDISWILMSEGVFIEKYPEYAAYQRTRHNRK